MSAGAMENGGVIVTKLDDLMNWSRLSFPVANDVWYCLLCDRNDGFVRIYL